MSAPGGDRRQVLLQALKKIEALEARLRAVEGGAREPVAVVGMGCRIPGGGDSPAAFWRSLVDGVDGIREVPADRWDVDAFFDADPEAPGKTYTRHGGFLDGVDRFDAPFFGVAPREAAAMDPQHRLALEVAWEALEDAGIPPRALHGTRTGVYFGITVNDYGHLLKQRGPEAIDVYHLTGNHLSFTAGRLSYLLGLQGPALAVDTACSSSLTALHLACRALRAGECDTALAGGVNLILSPELTITASKGRMLAPDGRCKTFDARADGFVRSEGCGVLVLRRLSAARERGDRVLALVRGSEVNQDGESSGLTVPNKQAQEAAIRAALADAGLDFGDVDYVEAHGTGTALGDPIEIRALADTYGRGHTKERPLRVGSVKTNVGHLEAAAGVAGAIKAILALRHETIPPHLHFETPNPHVDWEPLPIRIPTAAEPWPRGARPRRAAVSSFGASGTNVHAIFEEAPADAVDPDPGTPRGRDALLLALSARDPEALAAQARACRDALTAEGAPDAARFCSAANRRRQAFEERAALVAPDRDGLAALLDATAAGETRAAIARGRVDPKRRPKLAMLFSGQGSQRLGMGRELYAAEPAFRDALDRCAEAFRPHLDRPLLDAIHADPEAPGAEATLARTLYTQTGLFAVEWALAELWRSWGVEPDAVAGHSVGEYVAACVAGWLDLPDACALIAARARGMDALPEGGAMAVLFEDEDAVRRALEPFGDRLSVAAINGPQNVTVSGEADALDALLEARKAEGVRARKLVVSHAFHSARMEPMLDAFERAAGAIAFRAPRLPLVANVTGAPAGKGELADPAYWRRHVRQPVRFADSMRALRGLGAGLFLEIGPAPTLAGMGAKCFDDGFGVWVPSLRPTGGELRSMLRAAAELWAHGREVDLAACDAFPRAPHVALPTYPFRRKRHWVEAPPRADGQRLIDAAHPLVRGRVPSPLAEELWSVRLDPREQPWLADHRVAGRPIFPAAGFVELALAVGRATWGALPVVEDLVLHRPLAVGAPGASGASGAPGPADVQLVLEPERDGRRPFRVAAAGADGAWTVHATGALRPAEAGAAGAPATDAPDPGATGSDATGGDGTATGALDGDAFYERHAAAGFDFGPAFRRVERCRLDGPAATARVAAPAAGRWCVPPVALDACLQPLALFGAGRVPFSIDRVRVSGSPAGPWTSRMESTGDDLARATAVADGGAFRVEIEGIALRPVEEAAAAAGAERHPWLSLDVWREAQEPRAGAPAGRLRLVASAAARDALAPELDALGAAWSAVEPPAGDAARAAAAWRDALGAVAPGDRLAWIADEQAGSDAAAFLAALQALAAAPGAGIALATAGARAIEPGEGADPARAALWGVAGTARVERPESGARRLDFEPGLPGAQAAALARWLVGPDADRIALRGGRRLACRLEPAADAPGWDGAEVALEIAARGTLDGLELRPASRRAPAAGEVEIDVRASGLNFRDVLNALDLYPGEAGPLGCEVAGRVARAGDGVRDLRPGDRVVAFAPRGFATHVNVRAELAWPLPDALDWEEAATLPIAFLTAHLCLHGLARIAKGDRVLVHAAAGGVGMAAVQLARRAGATVYGTAGSESKRALLASLGVEAAFDSRSAGFVAGLREATGGRGVDVALNSLGGELIGATFEALADGGRFVEIGKTGIWTPEQVEALGRGIDYHVAYLGDVCAAEPERIRAIYRDVFAGLGDGSLRPLPRRVFPLEQAQAAFRFMAQARHRGKVVVRHRPADARPWAPRPDRVHAVAGGLRGLGLSLAERLVERGARALVLVGRSAPDDGAARRIEALRAAGADVRAVRGDAAAPETAQAAAEAIAALGRPPGILFHAAGVVDDATLDDQTADRLAAAARPKLDAARALDAAAEFERVVAFSSFTARCGAAGQANYVAANEALDAWCAARAAEGRPATAVAWGPFAGEGMAAALDARDRRRWESLGLSFMEPAAAWEALEAALALAPGNVAIADVDRAALAAARPADAAGYLAPPSATGATAGATGAAGTAAATGAAGAPGGVRAEIEALPARRRRERIESLVRDRLVDVLGLDDPRVDGGRGFRELGMDSLTAVELRNRLQQDLRAPLRSTLAFDFATVDSLVGHLAAKVFGLDAAADRPAEPGARPAPAADDLEGLTPEEAEALLLQELSSGGGEDDGR